MSQSKEAPFLAAAGGKWFLDTKFLLLTIPLVITTSILTTSSQYIFDNQVSADSWSTYAQLLIANIFAILICVVWIKIFSATVFRNRAAKPIPLFWVIAFSASVGAIKGIATGLGTWILGLDPNLLLTITNRVWQTTLLGAWLIPAMALVAARLSVLQEQRDSLVAERVSSALLDSGLAKTLDNKIALRSFATLAKDELAKIPEKGNNEQPNAEYAKVIRRLVTDQLRPLSHRIWDQENRRISSFSFSEVSRNAILNFSNARLVVALIYTVTAFPSILRFVPAGEALLRSALAGATIYLGFLLSGLLRPKRYSLAVAWFFLVNFAISYSSFYFGEVVFGIVENFNPFETILAVWLWLAQLTFISAFLTGIRKSGAEINQEFNELYGSSTIDKAVRQSQARIQNRDFANFLHGQVQNKLLSVALGLEKSEASKEHLEQSLALVEEILKTLESELDESKTISLQTQSQKLNEQWLGFVEIKWALPTKIETLDDRSKSLLMQVIEEGLSNSVRHGMAKHVEVRVQVKAESRLQVVVTDDGIGPRNGKPGLGSTFFKSVSKGNWTLEHLENGGAKLTVNF